MPEAKKEVEKEVKKEVETNPKTEQEIKPAKAPTLAEMNKAAREIAAKIRKNAAKK